jgi:hypothetical protein
MFDAPGYMEENRKVAKTQRQNDINFTTDTLRSRNCAPSHAIFCLHARRIPLGKFPVPLRLCALAVNWPGTSHEFRLNGLNANV